MQVYPCYKAMHEELKIVYVSVTPEILASKFNGSKDAWQSALIGVLVGYDICTFAFDDYKDGHYDFRESDTQCALLIHEDHLEDLEDAGSGGSWLTFTPTDILPPFGGYSSDAEFYGDLVPLPEYDEEPEVYWINWTME